MSTQRMVTAGLPERYQTAVWEVSSTVRVVPSYQETAATVHVRSLWSRIVFSEGRRGLSAAVGHSAQADGGALAHRGRRPGAVWQSE